MKTKFLTTLSLIILCFILFVSCKETRSNNHYPILKISYLNGNTERIIPFRCGEIVNLPIVELKTDTTILDNELIGRVIKQVKSLNRFSSNPQTGCDVKIDCLLKLSEKDSIKLCIGDFDCILKDGVLMERNDTLLYLVRRYSGYYNYFKETSLKYFKELNYFGVPFDYRFHKQN